MLSKRYDYLPNKIFLDQEQFGISISKSIKKIVRDKKYQTNYALYKIFLLVHLI
jgi:hypothetical protein